MKPERDIQICARCGNNLRAPGTINQTGDPAFAVYQEIVTVGMRPRVRSKRKRNCFCFSCGVSLGLGPQPEGVFNLSVHEMLLDVLHQNPEMAVAAVIQKTDPHAKLKPMPGSTPDKTLIIPALQGHALEEAS